MLKLYHVPISFNSRRVWIALLEKGLDFELIPVNLGGDQFKPEFLALNPFHHIPVLVDDDFTVIESLAILDYLEAKYPQPALLPTEAKAIGIVKMVNLVTLNELLPHITPLIQNSMGFREIESQKVEQHQQSIRTVLSFFEKLLGDKTYFGGDTFSLAEIVAGTVIPLLPNFGVSLKDYPQLNRWCKQLMQRESWQQTQAKPEDIEAFKSTMKKLMAQRS